MIKELEQVYKFNELGGQDLSRTPRSISKEAFKNQFKLIVEEVHEISDAYDTNDYEGVLDGLIDTLYVLLGLVNKLGLQKEFIEGFQYVHENNMTKVIDSEGNVIVKFNENGKIIKPDNFEPIKLIKYFPYLNNL